MDDLHAFTQKFTQEKLNAELIKENWFLKGPRPQLRKAPAYTTVRLGAQRRSGFTPSIALLDLIAPHTDRKAVVNEKSAWMFLCGNNILKEGIMSISHGEGPVLVLNERGEVMGYGDVQGVGVTNKLDRGDFLRRE